MPILQIKDKDGKFVSIPAINGKSAYEQAKDGGYNGTEEEFIAVLNGLTNSEDATHYKDFNNPHKVTKEQVGLGNVPNVTTNDQTPTYEEASELETLTSGEKLSVAFGKIKKAIADFILHLADTKKHNTADEGVSLGGVVTVGDGEVGKVSIGRNANGSGSVAVAIGPETKSTGEISVAIGGAASADGTTTIAIGHLSKAGGVSAVAIGNESESYADSVSIGDGSISYGVQDVTVGVNAKSSTDACVAIGAGSEAQQVSGIAIGMSAISGGANAIQLGYGTNNNDGTLQVNGFQLMGADGLIPSERLPIATGTYVGTGTDGYDGELTLNFGFTPKLVIVAPTTNIQVTDKVSYECQPMIMMYGVTDCTGGSQRKATVTTSSTNYTDYVCNAGGIVTWGNNSVSWKSEAEWENKELPAIQLYNYLGTEYKYIAIG